MPRFLQPKRSTQHRVAAIALYRALLLQCSSAPLLDDDCVSLRNAIRNKFRKNRKIQSPYQLGLSFKAGYETLDRLDACTAGNTASASTLARLIAALPRNLIRKPPTSRSPPPSPGVPKERLACLPPERAILNVRPYAKTSGPRHVPVLATTNGVPFLRLTKPQPPALNRVLRQRIERKQALFDMRIDLTNWWLPICQQEDQWDALINKQLREGEDGVKWVDAVYSSNRENQEKYDRFTAKDIETGRKMQRIVDLETKLALEEGQTIIRGRKRRPLRTVRP